MNELINLTDDELNARAAMAMGWEEIAGSQMQRLWRNGDKVMPKDAWRPASSLEQAFRLQDEVKTRGRQVMFIDGLNTIRLVEYNPPEFGLFLAHASARTRTIAAVYALEGGK